MNRNSTLANFQNRVRGAISNLHSSRVRLESSKDPEYWFHLELDKISADARLELSSDDQIHFLRWSKKVVNSLARKDATPKGYSALGEPDEDHIPGDLVDELNWSIENFRLNSARIKSHLKIQSELEASVLEGRYADSLNLLDIHFKKLGASVWAIKLRTAIESLEGGLDSQKEYSAQVRKSLSRGIFAYITYHISVRNESRTSLRRFESQIISNIDEIRQIENPKKVFLKYHLAHVQNNTTRELRYLIGVTQFCSIVDLFEVCREVSSLYNQERVSNSSLNSVAKSTIGILGKEVQEYVYSSDAKTHRESIFPVLVANGRVSSAVRRYELLRLSDKVGDPWTQMLRILLIASEAKFPSPIPEYFNQFSKLIKPDNQSNSVFPSIVKNTRNLEGIPVYRGLSHLLLLMTSNVTVLQNDGVLRQFILHWPSDRYTVDHNNLPATIWTMLCQLRNREYLPALELIDDFLENNEPREGRQILEAARVRILLELGRMDDAVDRVAMLTAVHSPSLMLFEPLEVATQMTWHRIRDSSSYINTATTLYAAWRINEDDLFATWIRYCVRKHLESVDFDKPSEWLATLTKTDSVIERHFSKRVCTPFFLDQIPVFESSMDVLRERIAICAAILALDDDVSGEMQSEIQAISEELALAEGEMLINSQRIHVDSAAFKRWSIREYGELFSRYQDMANLEERTTRDIDAYFFEALDPEHPEADQFRAKSQSELILVELLRELRSAFLENPRFGLDFHLSKRVRHQSFVGLIRAPIESSYLATSRSTVNGPYQENEYWLSKLPTTDSGDENELRKYFLVFIENFDRHILEAKDKRFHLKNSEKTSGMIDLPLPPRVFLIVKGIALQVDDYSEFLDVLISLFWILTKDSLNTVREYVSGELKERLVNEFDKLRSGVRKVYGHESEQNHEFDLVVGQASENVQRELDIAAGWFVKVQDNEEHGGTFDLDQVMSIAVNTANNMCTGITPKITMDIDENNAPLHFYTLSQLHDVAFVCLDNASKHSNLDEPKIEIHVRYVQDQSAIEVMVSTEMRRRLSDHAKARLSGIIKRYQNNELAGFTASEGGSGLLKLAASTGQHSSSDAEFYETDEFYFVVKLTYELEHTSHGYLIKT